LSGSFDGASTSRASSVLALALAPIQTIGSSRIVADLILSTLAAFNASQMAMTVAGEGERCAISMSLNAISAPF
jgi:hypothetical protein